MSEFFFVFKCLAITIVLAIFMQIRWGGKTLENHTETVVRNSVVTEFVQGTAAGVIVFGDVCFEKIKTLFRNSTNSAKESSERLGQKIKAEYRNSEDYVKRKASELSE